MATTARIDLSQGTWTFRAEVVACKL